MRKFFIPSVVDSCAYCMIAHDSDVYPPFQRWLYWVLAVECLLLPTPTLIYILCQQMRSTLANFRAIWYERKVSKWILKLRKWEETTLQCADELRTDEAQKNKSHVEMEAIRIRREIFRMDGEQLRLRWEKVKWLVERHMLYQPTRNFNVPNPAPRVEISGTKTEGM